MIDSRKGIFLVAGFGLVGLGTIGIFVPLLPTTPFLLLAAACFARSSERCHRWLLGHRLFGPILKNWHEHRCIPRRAKRVAVASILVFGGYAVGFALAHPHARIAGAALVLTGLVSVLRLPVCGKPH